MGAMQARMPLSASASEGVVLCDWAWASEWGGCVGGVPGEPTRIAVHGRGAGADAALGERVEPSVVGYREVNQGGPPAPEQLRERDPDAGRTRFVVALEHRQELVERAVVEALLISSVMPRRSASLVGWL